MKILYSLLLLLIITSAAYAADCTVTATTTIDMRNCNQLRYNQADKDLNQTYQKLLKASSIPYSKKALIKAESDWIKFRDSQCELEASIVAGGTAEPVFYGNCLIQMTKNRTETLRQLLKEN